MTHQNRFFGRLTRLLYGLTALALTFISISMIVVAAWDVWEALTAGGRLKPAMLDAIGLVVVALAVFDVAKYLLEEEVLRDRELRSATEARETLTKFVVIIVIAVSLEALVFILGAASKDLSLLVYPAVLLMSSTLMIVSLAVYLRLSSNAEAQLGRAGRALPRGPDATDDQRPSA